MNMYLIKCKFYYITEIITKRHWLIPIRIKGQVTVYPTPRDNTFLEAADFICSFSRKMYNKIVAPCFDSIRQSPYTEDTSSKHRYAPGFKG